MMNNELSQNELSPEERMLPRLRPELTWSPLVFDGQPFRVYKDPLSLRYYQFNREEYFIIEQLRLGVTLRQLKDAYSNEFNTDNLSNKEVGQFVGSLTAKNLLIMNQPDRDEIMFQAAKKRRRAKLFGQFSNFLFIKIPLYDPDRLFNRMIEPIRFLWSRWFFLVYLLLLAVAGGLVVARWHDFSSMFQSDFFTLYNVPVLFMAFWVVKAVHEFGHGLTCKNYGGEVHELGFLILVFMPMLYCNITDAWTFPSKAHRLLVTAGGIMVELLLAALAAIVWYYTKQPDFIHAFAFNVVIVCSISTIMFNSNPLLKFDGYYILMDLIEIPNLRQRSAEFMKNIFVRYFLGGHSNEMPEEHRFKFVFPLYSVSAYIYRWFIMFAILFSIYRILDQLHLVWLGRGLVVFSISTMLIVPLAKTGSMITKQRRALGISSVRLLMFLAVFVLGLAVALFWPLQQHITLNFILEPARTQWLRNDVDGRVSWAEQTREGRWIDTNSSVVAWLENVELPCEQAQLTAQIEQVKMEIDRWQSRGSDSRVSQLSERLETLYSNQRRLQRQLDGLEVKASFNGEILTRNQQIDQMRDRYLPRGTPLLLLAETRELVGKVWVPEKTLARIFKSPGDYGQQAEMMLYAFSGDKFRGRVSDLSPDSEDNMGEFGEKMALSNKVGGEVLTEYDPATGREKPMETVYEVTINIEQEDMPASARAYMSGRVRIDCGQYTLYRWGRESLLRFISPEVRL